ncbi:hypothetical protein GYMLUDRAFT_91451 [Collybiopsis luxurians FD-317 M1]|nr:hypothetical protein GYMLUDRAFT_91451 [Collybiopsis luxurians FD-317 M1]
MTSTPRDGTATPRPLQGSSARQEPGIEPLLSRLQADFGALDIHAAGYFVQDVERHARQLNKDVTQYKKEHTKDVDGIKARIRENYPKQIKADLSPEIRKSIESEVHAIAQKEIDKQFKALMPDTLQKQLEQTNEQLSLAKAAYINSESRRTNSNIDIMVAACMNDELKPVLKADGKQSSLWPADLNSLFAYDSESIKKLLKDYDLPVDKVQETNINLFLSHIGIKQQLIV